MKYITKVKREIGFLEVYEQSSELTFYGKSRLKALKEFRDAFEKLNLPVVMGNRKQLILLADWLQYNGKNQLPEEQVRSFLKEQKQK